LPPNEYIFMYIQIHIYIYIHIYIFHIFTRDNKYTQKKMGNVWSLIIVATQ